MKEHFILSNYLKASKTFAVYRDVFASKSLEHTYLPIEISTRERSQLFPDELNKLEEFIQVFKRNSNAISVVVSNPFKQYIPEFCDEIDTAAEQMNAVNLIVKQGNSLLGINIDGEAFFTGQREAINYDFKNKSILMLGCGGVSTAVVFKLAAVGVRSIHLFDTQTERERTLGRKLRHNFPDLLIVELPGFDEETVSDINVIYNGTGVGKKSDNPQSVLESPLADSLVVPSDILAIDANYTPWRTAFLRQCEENGCQTLNGFSHMIAFVALHLSRVLNSEIEFRSVKEIGERHV